MARLWSRPVGVHQKPKPPWTALLLLRSLCSAACAWELTNLYCPVDRMVAGRNNCCLVSIQIQVVQDMNGLFQMVVQMTSVQLRSQPVLWKLHSDQLSFAAFNFGLTVLRLIFASCACTSCSCFLKIVPNLWTQIYLMQFAKGGTRELWIESQRRSLWVSLNALKIL